MRLSVTLVGLIFALVFGMLTVVNGMQTVSAGEDDDDGDDVAIGCLNDDGDDDEEPNEEPVDDPDSEDNPEGNPFTQSRKGGGAEEGDPEDEDPYYEDDDCPRPTPPGFCGNMTEPGVYLFDQLNYGGNCLLLTGTTEDFTVVCTPEVCSWNDVPRSLKIVGNLGDLYLCLHIYPLYWGGFCNLLTGDYPDLSAINLDMDSSSLYFGYSPLSVSDPGGSSAEETRFAAADADCDGGVGIADALTDLQYLSGFEAGCAGDWDGDSYQGDADCNGDIASGDVVAILSAVASGSETSC